MDGAISLAMACYLIQRGANISAANNERKTPLDFVTETAAIDVLQTYIDQARYERPFEDPSHENFK